MGSELTGKILHFGSNMRVLAPGTYLDQFLLKNCANPTSQNSISIFLDHIRAQFHFLLDFSRIFSTQISLRYSQSLYQAHIHHSRVSSITIGPLYLQNTPYFNHLNHGIHKTPAHQGNFCRTVFV